MCRLCRDDRGFFNPQIRPDDEYLSGIRGEQRRLAGSTTAPDPARRLSVKQRRGSPPFSSAFRYVTAETGPLRNICGRGAGVL